MKELHDRVAGLLIGRKVGGLDPAGGPGSGRTSTVCSAIRTRSGEARRDFWQATEQASASRAPGRWP